MSIFIIQTFFMMKHNFYKNENSTNTNKAIKIFRIERLALT